MDDRELLELAARAAVVSVGSLVTFEGDMYRVTARGDRQGTFDIVRHPNDMLGDRWRNVPENELRPAPLPPSHKR